MSEQSFKVESTAVHRALPDYSLCRSLVADKIPSLIAYWDDSQTCRFANAVHEEWLGVASEDIVGTAMQAFLGAHAYARARPYIEAALDGVAQSFERWAADPNGTGRHLQACCTPDIVGGRVMGFWIQETDISRFRHSEEALQRETRYLRELFMQSTEGILVGDAEGSFSDVNDAACRLLKYPRAELIGMNFHDVIPKAELEHLRQARADLEVSGANVEDWTVKCKDGSFVSVEIRAQVLADGRRVGFMRDISEHKRALHATRLMAEALELRVAQRTEELRRLGGQLEAAEHRERRQIARDLHDDLSQTLAAAKIRLEELLLDDRSAVRTVAGEISALIDVANRSIRSLAAQLAPAVLYELGLRPALEWLGEEIEQGFGLRVSVEDDGRPKPLSKNASSVLYRATRELLINVAKHARAESAHVETWRDNEQIFVRVSDDGIGFDVVALSRRAPSRRAGLGLAGLRERLSFIDGHAIIESSPGCGTVAVLKVPLGTDCGDSTESDA